MKFDKKYFIPIIVIVLLWYPFYQGNSKTTIDQMKESISPLVDSEVYSQLSEQDLRKYFNLTLEEVNGVIGYKANDTMSAETLLIVKLNNQDDTNVIKEKMQDYLQKEHKKYDGYSLDQVRILDNYTMIDKKGYIFFSISDHQDWKETFQKSL